MAENSVKFRENQKYGHRSFSNVLDSDAMKIYFDSVNHETNIVGFDIFADGTLLSSSGSQSLCPIRIRFANIRGTSTTCHEVGIAPMLQSGAYFSQDKRRQIRLELFQRYMFLLSKDAIIGSRDGFWVDDSLIFVRLNTIAADQPE